ncbi:protein CDC73 homolog [Nicotiana tabacum]|uniref:Protein CDC73 homolog n=1 Tax=Nicotiana tabacum TaxID=4097 RepID=A0A1S3ZIB1_TOBAC|nr:PREDICTED: protein CDC73 homolog [Nicotiana tabacum]XP_016464111.1 PREDICTED: protein CDC73 homolog [Nicotiana tabacum]XP_016464112.1 PREDICTED: protein CDC73 homolog [Nicotiana tabacum]XP_016464113.1 PREDICTED: protein CDC73 homolog [Nicotiana tabacum]
MDPLTLLREYTIRNELHKIVRIGDDYRFGNDYSFPCTIETAYRSKHVQANRYTLETLINFITNHHLKHTDYIQQSRSLRIPAVTLPDRKPLLDYLTGKTASSDSIEFLKFPQPNETTAPISVSAAGVGNDENFLTDVRVLENRNPIELIRAVEKPLKDRESILMCKNRDFYSVFTAALRRDEDRQRAESFQRKDGLVAKNRIERGGFGGGDELGYDGGPKAKMHLKGSKIGEGVPIILVPSAFSTLITIYNVKEFLEDGVFIPTDVKLKQMKGMKPDCITVQKKFSRDRVVTAYEVRDKPSALKAEDWDRVVAVFVLGKEWQFKDWPFKNHVEIFNKIVGFFLRFEDDSVESAKTAKQWNVKIISISKNKRHQDRAAALEVWEKLEEFMRSRSH